MSRAHSYLREICRRVGTVNFLSCSRDTDKTLGSLTTELRPALAVFIILPGENFASLLIWNSSLLREQILRADSPFCSGASLA